MNYLKLSFSVAISVVLASCASPKMQRLPKSESGKGVVVAYSSTLNITSSFNYYVNNERMDDINGDKVTVVYLTPGHYTAKMTTPDGRYWATQSLNVQSGQYYFLNAYTQTQTNQRRQTTYHLDSVDKSQAVQFLQGPPRFTGWGDLLSRNISLG